MAPGASPSVDRVLIGARQPRHGTGGPQPPRRRRGRGGRRRAGRATTASTWSSSGRRHRWSRASPTRWREAGIACFGPSAAAAELEGSKAFAKEIMVAAGAPTAGYVAHRRPGRGPRGAGALRRAVGGQGRRAGRGQGRAHLRHASTTRVRRSTTRSCAGVRRGGREPGDRGVPRRARAFGLRRLRRRGRRAAAAQRRTTSGRWTATRGSTPAAWAPSPRSPTSAADRIEPLRETVFLPVLREMAARGTPFRGLLYAGLVDTDDGPKLLEFNVRFGDPETQVVLPAMSSDLGDLLWAAATGSVARRRRHLARRRLRHRGAGLRGLPGVLSRGAWRSPASRTPTRRTA